jgi:hypothetical protein
MFVSCDVGSMTIVTPCSPAWSAISVSASRDQAHAWRRVVPKMRQPGR